MAACNLGRAKPVVAKVASRIKTPTTYCWRGGLRNATIHFTLISSVALVSACGSNSAARHGSSVSSPPANPTAQATASTTAIPAPLFAVLETRRAGAQWYQPHDTIAIANSQGYAVARASFSPRSVPQQFDAATVMQPEAYVAAGAVYYADGSGVVRRLDPTGKVASVATFPLMSPEQELSFAVSPDGSQLMAARLNFPRLVGTPPPTPTGGWSLDIMKAAAGGTTTQVQHWQAAPPAIQVALVVLRRSFLSAGTRADRSGSSVRTSARNRVSLMASASLEAG